MLIAVNTSTHFCCVFSFSHFVISKLFWVLQEWITPFSDPLLPLSLPCNKSQTCSWLGNISWCVIAHYIRMWCSVSISTRRERRWRFLSCVCCIKESQEKPLISSFFYSVTLLLFKIESVAALISLNWCV